MRTYWPNPPPSVVGIDLGTTYSSAAVFNNGYGNITIIHDKNLKYLFSSIVTICQNGSILVSVYITSEAQECITFFDSKRFIGRKNVKPEELVHLPFETKLSENKVFYALPESFNVEKFGSNLITPTQISSLILQYIVSIFKEKYGRIPSKAVLGVPVEFDESQRNATIDAAKLAGLEVLRLVNEPTAASVACDVHNRPEVEYVVVLDLGGGTFDVSILYSSGPSLATISIAGNDRLGGRDFTEVFSRCMLAKTDNLNTFNETEYLDFLKVIEDGKIFLTTNPFINLSFVKREKFWSFNISLNEFEECTNKLFDKLLTPIDDALKQANLSVDEVQEVVLVGGATRMPKIRRMMSQYFKLEPNKDVDPDVAVVIGLANQAGIISQGWPLEKSAIDIIPRKLKKIVTH